MKKILRSLVLVVASAIPALSWAATNYGIYVDGTMINSDNCQNVKTTHLSSGTVKYDYSSNTLTLTDVIFNVDNESYFIAATSSVKNGLKIVVNGYNYVGDCNGVTIALDKPNNASASSPSYYFQGNGVLVLDKGEIETFNGPSVSFGKSGVSDTDGGLDIYANYIKSRNSAGGYVWISDANLHLTTGSTYSNGTFGGFTSVYMYNGIAAYSADGQNKYSYGSGNVLRDQNGNMVTGPAYIGYEMYGLNLCGKEVTAGNYNRLNVADIFPCSGTFSYTPSTKTLYMTNATLNDISTAENLKHYSLNNRIDGLKVNVTGTCRISENLGLTAIYSTGNITFQGTGNLSIYSSAGKAIDMGTTGKTLAFNNLTAKVEYGGIHCNNGTLSLSSCTLDVNAGGTQGGGILNMSKLQSNNTAVTTSGVYYDDRENKFYKVSSSSTYAYTGALNFKPVSNYYGIQVCGVELTEHNYNNVAAPYIKGGSITYNPSTNELTLNNLTIDTKERGAFPAIMIHSQAKTGMRVLLVGNNVIKKTNGAAIVFQKPTDATSVSNPHYYIEGTGKLTLEESGFLCFGYCNLCFGSGLQGGQGLGGCTIDAQYLQSRTAGEGRVWFTDCMMTLHGYGSAATFMNFADVFTSSHCVIRTPENGSYNSSSYYLADASGNKVTGEVYIGWEKYGLKICGIEVNEINKDNIQDRVNSTPSIYKYDTSTSTPTYGSVKYDPSTGTLTLNNVVLNDVPNSANTTACCIENTGKDLRINCTGQSEITMSRGNRATIYSTKSLEFRGSAPLEVYASTKNAIEIDGTGQTVKFNNCNTVVDGRGGNAINATRENQYGLNVQRANVTVKGSVHGIAYYNLANAAIATEKVFVQPANSQYLGCFREFGRGEYFGETVFKPVTTNYGILVSGHELNDVNANNFYFDDITTGTVSYDASSNTVTIDNVTANCSYKTIYNGEVVERHTNGINITSRATDNVKVNLVGNSVLTDINGVGIEVSRNTTFKGRGTLDIGEKTVVGYEGSNITVAESCTLNAGRMYGSEGVVHVTNQASLNLSGSNNTSYPTVYGFERFTANGYSSGQINTDIVTPNGGWYDEEHKQFVTHVIDGRNPVIGPVKIAPVRFHSLVIEGIAVTDANMDDIFRDLPHEGTMSLVGDSLCDMLCLDNFKVKGSTTTYGIQRFKTGRMFNVELKGENELKNFNYFHFGDGTYIKGGGSLITDAYTIYVYGSLFVEDCSISGVRWIECPDSASYTSLNVNKANLSLSGNYTGRSTIDGFKYFDLSNAVVTTPASYMYDSSDRQMEVNGSVYSGAVEILATENYDIAIGNMQITSLNKDDVFGDGTVSLSIDPDAQVYQLTLKNASLSDRLYIGWNCAADVIVCLEGQSSIKTEREDCIYSTRSIAFRSEDGTGKLDLLSKDGSGIFIIGDIILNGCDLTIQAGNYGIYNYGQAETAAGTAGSCAIGLLQGQGDTRLTIDTETRNGSYNLWNVGLYAEGPMEILRPVDANYNEMDGSICDVTGAPISGTVLEVLVKGASPAISVQDITDLIDQYLEGSPNITVQTITDLIDRYLNQGN